MIRRVAAVAVASASVLATTGARADDAHPQLNVGVDIGVGGTSRDHLWDKTSLFLGGRGDVLFGRTGTSSFGYGPAIAFNTFGFHAYSAGGGFSVLLPVHDYLPIVLTGGAYATHPQVGDTGIQPFGALAWGIRSFNFDGIYNVSGGLVAEVRKGVSGDAGNAIVIAAHLDGEILSLPLLMLINAFRSPLRLHSEARVRS